MNKAIIAAAGASKTQFIIEEALAKPDRQVLVTTYTVENLRQIESRICQAVGVVPSNVRLAGWFGFLLSDGIRPYQADFFQTPGVVRGLNFIGERSRYAKSGTASYYIDGNRDIWRDAASTFAHELNGLSGGAVMARLEQVFDAIYIDEVQDLVGWDLEILDLLFASTIDITAVGDPRQHTYATNQSPKNRQFRGAGLLRWLDARKDVCVREDRQISQRCHQDICDFASGLFPHFAPLESGHDVVTGHDGVHTITHYEALEYYADYQPQVLRWDKREKAQGLPAMNIGVSKGSTFDRVLIFPTKPMIKYLQDRDPSKLKRPESLYVAVTRARHSVTFVV